MNEFVDTNILVYAYSADANQKREASAALISRLATEEIGVISAQVLVEFYNTALRKLQMESDVAEAIVCDFIDWRLHSPTHSSIVRAIDLQRRYQLAWYDAMILNSAIESGCSILWTEDFQDGQRFGDLVIRNPYKNARVV